MQIESRIQRLAEREDVQGLIRILRQDGDPRDRILAVRALASLDDQHVPEALIGAALHDPDSSVQDAARKALREMLGFQAQLVLAFAAATSEPDPNWLMPAPPEREAGEEEGQQEEWGLTNAEGETLHGLIAIAQSDPRRETRLKAVAALGRVRDMTATHVLAELALWDDDDVVSEAAYRALEATFGPDADRIIEEVRRETMGEREAEREDPFEAARRQATQRTAAPRQTPPRAAAPRQPAARKVSPYNQGTPSASGWSMPKNSSVIKEEGAPFWLLIPILVLIAAGVWWFFIR